MRSEEDAQVEAQTDDPEQPNEGGKQEAADVEKLQAKVAELEAEAKLKEEQRREAEKRMTQSAQEAAELRKAQKAAEQQQTFASWEADLRAKAEEDPGEAVAEAARRLAFQQQQAQAEMAKALSEMQANMSRQILRSNPETAKLVDTLDAIKSGSEEQGVEVLRSLLSQATEAQQRTTAAENMADVGGKATARTQTADSLAAQIARDPKVMEAARKAGFTDPKEIEKWAGFVSPENTGVPLEVEKDLAGLNA